MNTLVKIGKKNYRMSVYWAPTYFWTLVGLMKDKDQFINDINENIKLSPRAVDKGITCKMVDMDIVNHELRFMFDVSGFGLIRSKVVNMVMQKNIKDNLAKLNNEEQFAAAVMRSYERTAKEV